LAPENPRRRSRGLSRSTDREIGGDFQKEFDTSGKSPAYLHHRKNYKRPRRETGRGLFHLHSMNRVSRIGRRPHFTGAPSSQPAHRRKTRLKARCRPNHF
jgi:hypothetical protein